MLSTKILFCYVFLFYVLESQSYSIKNKKNNTNTYGDDKIEQVVKNYGYPIEKHFVKTDDNYILRIHHIPHGVKTTTKKNGVVFIQHGLLSCSADSLVEGPDFALSLILADSGFDIWLGNARGNMFSRNHTILDPDKDKNKFWDFSFHEIGTIDDPTMIDYILEKTGQKKLFYIGHSQGTTTFFIMASEKPKYNDKILAQFSLAPAIYMGNINNKWLHVISNFNSGLGLLPRMGIREIGPSETTFIIKNVLCGYMPAQCTGLTGLMTEFYPAGSSSKQLIHFAQEIKSGQFRQFDYAFANYLKYGQFQPPSYKLSNVKAPVYLFYSKGDQLGSSEKDVFRLCKEIQNCKKTINVADGNYTHFDFLTALDAKEKVYNDIIKVMDSHIVREASTQNPTSNNSFDLKLCHFMFILVPYFFLIA